MNFNDRLKKFLNAILVNGKMTHNHKAPSLADVKQSIKCGLMKMLLTANLITAIGIVDVEVQRPDGSIYKQRTHNGIVNVGKNSLLDVYFHNQTQIATWYIGLVDNASFSAFDAADTMGSHAGWIEVTTYDEATRNEWTEGAASSQSITNAVALTFTMNATKTLKGIFVTSGSAKSGTTGTLWSTAAFASTIPVNSGDLVKITYTVSV